MTHDLHLVIHDSDLTSDEMATKIIAALLDGKCTVIIGPGEYIEDEKIFLS